MTSVDVETEAWEVVQVQGGSGGISGGVEVALPFAQPEQQQSRVEARGTKADGKAGKGKSKGKSKASADTPQDEDGSLGWEAYIRQEEARGEDERARMEVAALVAGDVAMAVDDSTVEGTTGRERECVAPFSTVEGWAELERDMSGGRKISNAADLSPGSVVIWKVRFFIRHRCFTAHTP